MAEDKDKIAKLEERLANAATTFKDMKGQLDAKEKENEELKTRVTELEDELTLNGGASKEVDDLKARLEKAKEIFTTQKNKIAELTKSNETKMVQISQFESDIAQLTAQKEEFEQKVSAVEEVNKALAEKITNAVSILSE